MEIKVLSAMVEEIVNNHDERLLLNILVEKISNNKYKLKMNIPGVVIRENDNVGYDLRIESFIQDKV